MPPNLVRHRDRTSLSLYAAPLPKSRRLLSGFQLIQRVKSAADEGNSTQPTASLPMTTPLHVPHMPESQTPTGLPEWLAIYYSLSNKLYCGASAVNGPPYVFPMASPAHESNLDEELLDLRTQTLFPPVQGSEEGPASIDPALFDMMPTFSQFNPNPEMASRSQISNPMSLDTFNHAAIPEPSKYGMKTNSNEHAAYRLQGLAWKLGYRFVPL
ncbi:uncharacterized protein EI90DRAFT_2308442 [Cantharellus anzutake]|uniref:uncharacterized protein n=1 Tax=Cantharellus anzutake TaxID=1750568 RepID=UPI001908C391|nr:uncharacterized protein EI90DRAFT_2308442 [Cantharellus anzutake]KAF8339952.1 hypothetical protein EI90DRAFT_2308442 [Cantharellus anzutake]